MMDSIVATLSLSEADRQMVLLALATLACERPGFTYALSSIAVNIDSVYNGHAVTFEKLIELNKDKFPVNS